MRWYFPQQLPGEVDTEVTQRDQFSNDEVDLSQTIVREAIQNSLDAAKDEPPCVTVSFRWVDLASDDRVEYLRTLLNEQLEHARAAKLNLEEIDFELPTALVIEDFGTTGLTGNVHEKTDDHFTDFWRRHGKSHKSGGSRGRWGLGKLVYSTSSQIGAFFGVTVRKDDPGVYLMGQTVLNLHSIDGSDYKPHAFFGDLDHEGDLTKEITVPIKDEASVNAFVDNFFLRRATEPGLSVVIPYPNPAFNRENMIGIAIANYFYPIITQQLVLQFGNVRIDHANIRELANKYAANEISDIDRLFDFIEIFDHLDDDDHHMLGQHWFEDQRLDENDFEEDTLEDLRQKFSDGELLAFRFPIEIKKKDGIRVGTFFSAYIQKPAGLERGTDLYVRRGLTLPGEKKFRERKALGAVIAEDEPVCAFLGYAENPAHTQWIGSSEKLKANYQAPQKIVAAIKKSLVQIYDVLACVLEDEDELALLNYFFGMDPKSNTKRKKKKKTPEKPVPPPPPKPRDFAISKLEGGFAVATTKNADPERFPQTVKIEVAYDISRGDPFKTYSPMDFTMGKNGGIEVAATPTGKVVARRENQIKFEVSEIPFGFTASGFDPHRDIKIRLTKEA